MNESEKKKSSKTEKSVPSWVKTSLIVLSVAVGLTALAQVTSWVVFEESWKRGGVGERFFDDDHHHGSKGRGWGKWSGRSWKRHMEDWVGDHTGPELLTYGYKALQLLDADQDGAITDLDAVLFFDTYDSNSDNEISPDEQKTLLSDIGVWPVIENLDVLVDKHSRAITRQDWENVWERFRDLD